MGWRQPNRPSLPYVGMKTGRQCRIMAAEAAGRAYITTDQSLKAHLTAHADAWVRLGEMADRQDAFFKEFGIEPSVQEASV